MHKCHFSKFSESLYVKDLSIMFAFLTVYSSAIACALEVLKYIMCTRNQQKIYAKTPDIKIPKYRVKRVCVFFV